MLRGGGDNKLLENHSSISRLVALKPRQVLLAEQKQQQQEKHQPRLTMTKKQLKEQLNQKTLVLNDDHKLALLHSVVKYIGDKGFAKTLKRFLKEAQVEDDAWKANSFDLEEMYCNNLENCRNGDTNTKGLKEQEESAKGTMLKDADGDEGAPLETVNKKKKKKNDDNAKSSFSEVKTDNDDNAKSSFSEVKTDNSIEELKDEKKKKKKNAMGDKDGLTEDDAKKKKKINEENDENAKSSISEVKKDDSMKELTDKKKKKSKLTVESPDGNGMQEDSLAAVTEEKVALRDTDAVEILLGHNKTEPKEKKKKKKVSVSEKLSDNGVEVFGNEQSQGCLEDGTGNKSKKRKRSASDGSKDKQVEGVVAEEYKRRKTEGTEEAQVNAQQAEVELVHGDHVHLGGETKEESGNVSQSKPPKPSIKQFDESEKGNLTNNGVGRHSEKKIAKKQSNGSAEPKTVNAFQRVKVDAVEYADERLQDNSYWAKDGAENGYGAKAQEILGQVKGRGFRHEKTKKKRGSYRGGLIDLHSHSVKFNYSDDE